ncbi:hypothetical protein [Rhizobium leguminosarum]|uniref:hypothetical protein n=1 Tax=Rhizobium leguminosarum TaxID=384 RepID=UPI00103076B1|nr:hypothetical protein [Rhizobium leguminosarum]TAV81560.1 hypothetical protein ELI22_33950 [Rhizobium leguminosarum]TAV94166.1 hypothetical protein ELI21_10345 [Rhizobium leguminosarum]TAW35241.1 hypothetical protein ELI23_10385 [Rhizobium leguminosarum]
MTAYILSKAWCPVAAEQAYDLKVAARSLYEELGRFDEIVDCLANEADLVGAAKRLSRVIPRLEDRWQTWLLPDDFDDFDLGHLGQFPRKSAGNCGAGLVDGSPVTGQGQRMARDPS